MVISTGAENTPLRNKKLRGKINTITLQICKFLSNFLFPFIDFGDAFDTVGYGVLVF